MENDDLVKQLLEEFNESIGELRYEDESENIDAQLDDNQNTVRKGNKLISYDFQWIEGLRAGSRLVWVPREENIYYSNTINIKRDAISCTCYENSCTARILILSDGTAAKESNSQNHTHGSLYQVYKERYLFSWMKERCRTAPASALIRDIYNEAVML